MDNNVYEKFLPLGTVVILKNAKKRLMVTGFCTFGSNDKKKKMYDYSGCLFPEGLLSSSEIALFNHDQIEKVFHLGLSDEEEKNFKKILTLELEKNEILKFEKKDNVTNQSAANNVAENKNVEVVPAIASAPAEVSNADVPVTPTVEVAPVSVTPEVTDSLNNSTLEPSISMMNSPVSSLESIVSANNDTNTIANLGNYGNSLIGPSPLSNLSVAPTTIGNTNNVPDLMAGAPGASVTPFNIESNSSSIGNDTNYNSIFSVGTQEQSVNSSISPGFIRETNHVPDLMAGAPGLAPPPTNNDGISEVNEVLKKNKFLMGFDTSNESNNVSTGSFL